MSPLEGSTMKQRHDHCEIEALASWLQRQASQTRALADADATPVGRCVTLSDAEKLERISAILQSLSPQIARFPASFGTAPRHSQDRR